MRVCLDASCLWFAPHRPHGAIRTLRVSGVLRLPQASGSPQSMVSNSPAPTAGPFSHVIANGAAADANGRPGPANTGRSLRAYYAGRIRACAHTHTHTPPTTAMRAAERGVVDQMLREAPRRRRATAGP